MNLQEAIVVAREKGMWFRPVTWRSTGYAFCLSSDELETEFVPPSCGGRANMIHNVKLLLGDWEVVSVDEVLGGEE
jgi:hypothetical protein